MRIERDWKYIALDESNHGKFPEVFVTVFSNYDHDIQTFLSPTIPKLRGNHKNLTKKLRKRDYSFLLFDKQDYNKKQKDELFGLILGSLISDFNLTENACFFIDGILENERLEYVNKIIREVSAENKYPEIIYGKDLDRRNRLVNVADETAHWLFKKPLITLVDHPQRKYLNKNLLNLLC